MESRSSFHNQRRRRNKLAGTAGTVEGTIMIDKIIIARKSIMEELKRRGKAHDTNVKPGDGNFEGDIYHDEPTKTEHYWSGSGKMLCPICNKGELYYSRASYNGHVHARCSTENCVSWME